MRKKVIRGIFCSKTSVWLPSIGGGYPEADIRDIFCSNPITSQDINAVAFEPVNSHPQINMADVVKRVKQLEGNMADCRSLRFYYTDGTFVDFVLGKCTVIRKPIKQVVFHLDRLPSGDHLIIVQEEVLPDDKKLDKIVVIRGETE